MATVNVHPMPTAYRAIPRRWRPMPPPIFPDGEPTPADRAYALELWRALDPESQEWYGQAFTD